MQQLKKHKELIPIIAIAIALSIAAFDLFSDQQNKAELLNLSKNIDPVTISGRAACEVPIPDLSKQETEAKLSTEAKN